MLKIKRLIEGGLRNGIKLETGTNDAKELITFYLKKRLL